MDSDETGGPTLAGWSPGVGSWVVPVLAQQDGPPDAWLSWLKDGEEGKAGNCKLLLGVLRHPPLAPTRMLPFHLKRASFQL